MTEPEGGRLRSTARTLLFCGAIISVGLMIAAGMQTPPFLLVIFVFWVVGPYVALGVASSLARRWTPGLQSALQWLTLVVSVASPVIYGMRVSGFHGWKGAFVFTLVPGVTGALVVIFSAIATFQARRSPV